MELTHKQKIIKLLDLDAMIEEYISSSIPKSKTQIKPNLSFISQRQIIEKVPVNPHTSKLINKRAQSQQSMAKKQYISGITNNFNATKTSSSRISQTNYHTSSSFIKPNEGIEQKEKGKSLKLINKRTCNSERTQKTTKLTLDETNAEDKVTHESIISEANETNKEFDHKISLNLKANMSKRRTKVRLPYSYITNKTPTILKGRYQMEKLIGRGLSGEVYKAKDILSNRDVAIKIISEENIEYAMIKNLDHPNLITYYNSFIENNKRYIILEYLPRNLSEVCRKIRLSESVVKKIFKSMVSAVQYLHSLSYAHRDIKLDNIVVSEDLETVKFIDFGLCVDTADCDVNEKKKFCGTTSYMAPEIISGTCLEPKKADIWSLGVALYHLCVGRNPFVGKQENEIFHKIQNSKLIFPEQLSQSLIELLSKMLKKDPHNRPSIIWIINHEWFLQ